MGVPAFFRRLVKRYRRIVSRAIELRVNQNAVDANPNTEGDRDFDCLYLDMNGIIHPCFHPEKGVPETEEEIFVAVERYILRVFNIVRPRVLLYMAIDGVAPRAKMVQQRMRRFRAAKDRIVARLERLAAATTDEDRHMAEVAARDSNCITPGSEFFQRLTAHLREWIGRQLARDPAWRQIFVFLSDASVPGEGEHKIMSFIRSQRFQYGYDPNRRHVIYGLDADLIFLGLTLHEPYVYIIREDLIEQQGANDQKDEGTIGPEFFNFVSLWMVRQYLERDLRPHELPEHMEWNFERALGDFVLLLFAAGNDFLPNLPGLSMHGGAIDVVARVYREQLPGLGAYLTFNGGVDRTRLCWVIQQLARGETRELDVILHPSAESRALEAWVNAVTDSEDPQLLPRPTGRGGGERSAPMMDQSQLKVSYYSRKFMFTDLPTQVRDAVGQFVKGMSWTLQYYVRGCVSWSWHYPYLWAPCASDFEQCPRESIFFRFELAQPWQPFEQLLAVLPPDSASLLPAGLGRLLTDPASPIAAYYPRRFRVDLRGGTVSWHGVVDIPFVDQERLRDAISRANVRLTEAEQVRNSEGRNRLFMHDDLADLAQGWQRGVLAGPGVWGRISRVASVGRGVTEWYYDQPGLPPDVVFCQLLNGVVLPPLCVDDVAREHNWDGIRDPAFNPEEVEAAWDLPLQVPGVAPGAPASHRRTLVRKASLGAGGAYGQ